MHRRPSLASSLPLTPSRVVRHVATLAGVLLLAVAATAACARKDKAGDTPFAARVAEITPKLEKATGLTFKRPPVVESHSKTQVRAFLEKTFSESRGARDIEAKSRVYKRLGLLPDTLDVRALYLDLLTEQIAGFYDPKTKKLYVVEGADEALTGITLTHELVHALQDQYVNLDSVQNAEAPNDRAGAVQAVLEGQAMYEQLAVVVGDGNVAARMPGGWDRVRQMIREAQGSMPVFAAAPVLIQETLIFPYLSGAEFMRRFKARRPGVSPLGDLPTSTEQIMHEGAYFDSPRDEPTTIAFPALGDTVAGASDVLGEFETRLFLYEHLRDQPAAARGAMGWDGDRYALLKSTGGETLVWASVWDSPVDAAEFLDLLAQATERRYEATVVDRGAGVREMTFNGRTVRITSGDVAGRPVVLYVDAPVGASTSPVALDALRIGQ